MSSLFVFCLLCQLALIDSQNIQQSAFQVYLTNQDVSATSSNLIVTLQTDQITCLIQSNQNVVCGLIVVRSNGSCSLYTPGALSELVASSMPTSLFQKQNAIPIITYGLINYWPIYADLKDYVGSANLIPGSATVVSYGLDRYNNPSASLFLNNAYYALPAGIYFNGPFSIVVWLKIVGYTNSARVIDCSNGVYSDNVILGYSYGLTGQPFVQDMRGTGTQGSIATTANITVGEWTHLVATLDAFGNAIVYINAVAQVDVNGIWLPNPVVRSVCNIGRSAWWPGDADAYAYFDEIKIYNRALSAAEIQYDYNL